MRNPTVEALRLVSCFGIVWFHEGAPFAQFWYGGLVVFLILFFYFEVIDERQETLKEFVIRRADRLMRPWLAWSVVYGALKFADDSSFSFDFDKFDFQTWMIFTGPRIHLWFLPFCFLCGILIFRMKIFLRSMPVTVCCLAIVISGLFSTYILNSDQYNFHPVAQYFFSLPAIFFACMLALRSKVRGLQQADLLIAAVSLGALSVVGSASFSIPYAVGYIASRLAIVNLAFKPLVTFGLEKYSYLSFPIYLVHPAASSALSRFDFFIEYPISKTSAVFFLSFLVSWVISKLPIRRFML